MKTTPRPSASREPRHRPLRVRIPGFLEETDIGLGDAIKRVTYAVGLKPCPGCERRAALLNRWVRLGGGRSD